jgi:hypothetical protein
MDDDTQATPANRHDYLAAFYIYMRGCFQAAAEASHRLVLTHTVASAEHGERELFKRNGAMWVESIPTTEDTPR